MKVKLKEKRMHGVEGEEEEITSPLKAAKNSGAIGKEKVTVVASMQLFQMQGGDKRVFPRKRKSNCSTSNSSMTPDLNIPAKDDPGLVPSSLVLSRVNQLALKGEKGRPASEELSKKRRKNTSNHDAPSAVAASGSPRRAQ
jgi:hypothetical protein